MQIIIIISLRVDAYVDANDLSATSSNVNINVNKNYVDYPRTLILDTSPAVQHTNEVASQLQLK